MDAWMTFPKLGGIFKRKPVPTARNDVQPPEYRKSYGPINVSGQATAHIGDRYDHNYHIQQATFVRADGREGPSSEEIANWLSSADYEKHQHDIFTTVQPGSGVWLLYGEDYVSWQVSASNLVLCGIPGAGKTVLASIIIDHLRNMYASDNEAMVLFYYNSFRRQKEQSASNILSTLLRQAFLHDTFTARGAPARELYETHHRRGRVSRPAIEELVTALTRILKSYTRIFLVIDALDECMCTDDTDFVQREIFLGSLIEGQRQTGRKLAMLFTTRPSQDYPSLNDLSRQVNVQASEADVSAYIRLRLSQTRKPMFQRSDLQHKILATIARLADGMFLLTKLQMDLILSLTTPNSVIKLLNDMSHATDPLKTAYESTLHRIQETPYSTIAGRALSCVVFGKRPLNISELRQAIAIRPGVQSICADDLEDVQLILESCVGLLVIDEQSEVVRVVHYTTQVFLESTTDPWFLEYRHYLSQACLLCLSLEDVRDWLHDHDWSHYSLKDRNNTFINLDHAFLQYALPYWSQHLRQDTTQTTWATALKLLHDQKFAEAAFWMCEETFSYYKSTPDQDDFGYGCRWMHLLAWLDMRDLFEYIASHPSLMDGKGAKAAAWANYRAEAAQARDSKFYLPVLYAACAGNHEFVQLLLSWSDGYPTTWNHPEQSLLYHLIRHGHGNLALDVLSQIAGRDMLLTQTEWPKGNMNICWLTANEAVKHNLTSVLQILLAEYRTIKLSDQPWSTCSMPYRTSGLQGTWTCTEILVEAAESTVTFEKCMYALLIGLAESTHGSPTRLQLLDRLLQRFPNLVNLAPIPNESNKTMLHVACSVLNTSLINYLASFPGIDWNVRDGYGRSPIMLASSKLSINESVLKMICAHSNVNYQQPLTGMTALHHAANAVEYWGRGATAGERPLDQYGKVSRILVDSGLDPTLLDREGRTADDVFRLRNGEKQMTMRLAELEQYAIK